MSSTDTIRTAAPALPANAALAALGRTHRRGRTALLLDLENLLVDQDRVDAFEPIEHEDGRVFHMPLNPWVDDPHADAAVAATLRHATTALGGQPHFRLAVAAKDLITRAAWLPSMQAIACMIVENGPDAADHAILDIAEHLASLDDDPYTDFVIGSGDRIFTDFAARHPTTVVARRRHLSRDLRMAAVRVHLLDEDLLLADVG